jgi:polyhydroxyalkanoate synthesis repressor PhaR
MSNEPLRIKRYPNRRFYATHTSRYISLPEIEQLIRDGATVEIVDSQTGEDLTRTILMQIIAEKHPDKIAMFPTAMLHSILCANEAVSGFLQAYFRNALTPLEYLQRHGATGSLEQPMHWMKAWLDNWPMPPDAKGAPKPERRTGVDEEPEFAERIARLEKRIAELEADRAQEG